MTRQELYTLAVTLEAKLLGQKPKFNEHSITSNSDVEKKKLAKSQNQAQCGWNYALQIISKAANLSLSMNESIR